MLTEAQLEERKTGIGGSEVGAILGESRFAAPFDVWLSKVHGWRLEETDDMRRGSFLEDGIARWYAQRYGHDLSRLSECKTLRHRLHPWALCTSDRMVTAPAGRELLSIKSPRRGGGEWGDAGTDQVPSEYLLQLQWEWAIHASHGMHLEETMHLAALLDGDLEVFIIKADVELQRWMLEAAGAWWERHVVQGVQPELDGSSQARAWLRRKFRDEGEHRAATPREIRLLIELEHAQIEAKRWAAEEEQISNALRLSMGTAQRIESPGAVATWKADKNGKRSFKTKFTNKEK
jgi:putative phage-type endonuclease